MGTLSGVTDGDLPRRAGRLRILRTDQLLAAGLSPDAIKHRVAQDRLQRLWRGVYLVGPDPVGPLSLAHGATEAYDGDVYVTNGWGCFVHGFAKPPGLPVDILVVSGSRARRDGILPHRSGTLADHDVGHARGIAVASPARAILGCAATHSVMHVTWDELIDEPLAVVARIAGALAVREAV